METNTQTLMSSSSIQIVHLLAEAHEGFHHELSGWWAEAPLSFVLCAVGFALVFFIEKVILLKDPDLIELVDECQEEQEEGKGHRHRRHDHRHSDTEKQPTTEEQDERRVLVGTHAVASALCENYGTYVESQQSAFLLKDECKNVLTESEKEKHAHPHIHIQIHKHKNNKHSSKVLSSDEQRGRRRKQKQHKHNNEHGDDTETEESSTEALLVDEAQQESTVEHDVEAADEPQKSYKDHHHHAHFLELPRSAGFILPYVLLIVLSAHSLIAGITLGIQPSLDTALPVFIAIVSHKWIESFALGISFLRADTSIKSFIKLVAIFSVMVPSGMLIGIALQFALRGKAGTIATAVCTAIGSGTFLYVAIVDILLDEFMVAKDKYLKFGLAVFGFVAISSLIFAFPHDHDH
ncbi:ZIP Zinc transporter family protein, variant 4 [Balamuthia mandrillaris]